MKLHWYIANRYLKSKRKESFISFISGFSTVGICLGVAVLIIVMSVMNGFKSDIIKSIIGTNSHIYITSYSKNISDYKDIINYVKDIQSKNNNKIIEISPTISEQVLISHYKNSSGIIVTGITFEDISARKLLYDAAKKYNLSKFKNNQNVILLGTPVARYLGVKLGDKITMVSPNGYVTVLGSLPSTAAFEVIGLISTGMYQYDSSLAIIPFKKAQSFFMYEDNEAQNIEIQLENPFDADKIALNLYKRLKNVEINTWATNNKYLMNALSVEKNVMFLILFLVIIIAAFNIVSSLVMLVRSKTKEIAVLKTMGMLNKDIILIFMLIGMRIGLKGTIIGGILGSVISLNLDSIKKGLEKLVGINLFPEEVYFLSQLPSEIQISQVCTILMLSFLVALLSTIYPSIQASKVNPSKGIKYE